MDAIVFNVSGNWGHFKKVDTNNNPLTHDFITKTALIGMIGAVNGIERMVMKELFPQLSEDLMYGVMINNQVQKESWGFTLRSVNANLEKSPWQFEFLKCPDFSIVLALYNERSVDVFTKFVEYVKKENACFNPTLGLANCPANLKFISYGKVSDQKQGDFSTQGFISKEHTVKFNSNFDFRIGFDSIPTFQNNDFWNLPEKYVDVAYCSGNNSITASGKYYELTCDNLKSQWFLI